MLNNILKLEGAKVLSKDQQKSITGGNPCCDPELECCVWAGTGGTTCTGCTWCHSSGACI